MGVTVTDVAHKAALGVSKLETKLNSRPVLVGLNIATAFVFSALLVFNYLSANPGLSGGLFEHGQSEVSQMYPVHLTPSGWAFSIWGLIYLLMVSWVLYNLALLCRLTPEGAPAYLSPTVLSPAFLIYFNLSSIFNTGWLFLFDRLLFVAAFVFLACIAVCLVLAWAIAAERLTIYKNFLVDQGRRLEVRFLTVAVVNGLAMYATWTCIATLINLNVVVIYKWDGLVSVDVAATIGLAVLGVGLAVYTLVDLAWLDRYNRYTLAPYLTVAWGAAAIIDKNWNPVNTSSLVCAVVLGGAVLAGLSKVTLAVARCRSEHYQYRQMKAGQ